MISLGISYYMHDSSACLTRDGEVLFAVAEERLSRAKHDARFPHHAIKACLDFAKVRPDLRRRLGQTAQESIRHYTWNRVARRVEKVFTLAAQNGKRPRRNRP